MGKRQTVPVTARALVQRINRKLAAAGQRLKATRGARWRGDLGDYYTIDTNRNCVVAKGVDPAALGREIGVLRPWESVAE
jgi:hypothetical protein